MPLGAFRLGSFYLPAEEEVPARTAHTVTVYGNAQVDTAQSKFGGASMLLDGNGDYITFTGGDTTTTNGDLTLEFFIRFAAHPTTGNSGYMMPWNAGGSNYLNIYGTTFMQLAVGGRYGTVSLPTISTNTWYHVAAVRSSGTFKVYWDGTDRGAFTNDSNWPPPASTNWAQPGTIGTFDSRGGVNGHIDEFRISHTARYTANFTPPTAAFVNDADTRLLLHFDGTDGSTTFTDDNS